MSKVAPNRRGLLRGLASLPLVGGSVAILGRPTAAAEPVTPALLNAYEEWLDVERSFLKWERFGPSGRERPDMHPFEAVYRDRRTGALHDYRPCSRMTGYGYGSTDAGPSTRAAIVLAAVGIGWREVGL